MMTKSGATNVYNKLSNKAGALPFNFKYINQLSDNIHFS